MTTITCDNEYDSSHAGQTSSPGPDNNHAAHQNNGQGYSQSSGNSGMNSQSGSKPEDERKLFVGGLTWDTTPEDLREYFSNFGNISDCSIKHDPTTGRSRGFAFLVFDSKDIVEKILSQNEHFVKGRKVDPKPAHRRAATANNQPSNNNNYSQISSQSSLYGVGSASTMPYATMNMSMGANANPYSNNRKVFIGGLDPSFPDSQLREYFSKFGKIDEIDLPYDKEKNERRPFCFISFHSEQAAQEVLRLQKHTIGDISVDVKRAKPKTSNNQQQVQQQHLYDPYGQQSIYGNYNTGVPTYGATGYHTADPYGQWNTYNYNHQGNPSYHYGNPGPGNTPSSGTASYPQYPDAPSNPQHAYPPTNATVSDYYSNYNYGVPLQGGPYADLNAYDGGYNYGAAYPSMNTGAGVSVNDNPNCQLVGNSQGNPADYEHDNHHGKAKTTIVSSPTYHPYSRT